MKNEFTKIDTVKVAKEVLQTLEEKYGVLTDKKDIDINAIMDRAARSAYYGGNGRVVQIATNDIVLLFEGTVYAQGYEDYTADCDVYQLVGEEKKVIFSVDSHCTGPYKYEIEKKGSLDDVHALWNGVNDEKVFMKVIK